MARIARLIVPGPPYHVTQRGNRRLNLFFSDDDFPLYLDLLSERCRIAGAEI
jgi:putative transposase